MTAGVELLIQHYGIVIAALLIFLTELGIPIGIPNEVILVLAGAYAIHSTPEFIVGFALVCAADVGGTTSLYLLTRSGGNRLLRRFVKRSDKPQRSGSLRQWLRRHDIAVIIVARSLPFVRMSVAISAGLMRIKREHYLLGVIPGAIVWAGTPLTLGYLFRNDVRRLIDRDEALSQMILLAIPVVLLTIGLIWLLRRRRAARHARSEEIDDSAISPPTWQAPPSPLDERSLELEHEASGGSAKREV